MSFPWVRSRVEQGELQLIAAYFDVGSGALTTYDPATAAFAAVGAEGLPWAPASASAPPAR